MSVKVHGPLVLKTGLYVKVSLLKALLGACNPIVLTRLDFCLIPYFLMPFTESCIKPSILSDHSIIIINLNGTPSDIHGPGFWKFNSSLLEDENFIKQIKNKIGELKRIYENMTDKHLKWDTVKCELRGEIIKICSQKSKEIKLNERDLKYKLNQLFSEISVSPTPENLNKSDEIKGKLEEKNDKETKGIILRSKAKWYEESERCTKYFLSSEKRNFKNKSISKLVINKRSITNKSEITCREF